MTSGLTIKRILFATDFLESSRLALDYAVAFAHQFSATLVMMHAVVLSPPAEGAELVTHKPSLSRRDAQGRLEALATGVRRTGIAVETQVEQGAPWQVILETAQTQKADLLVLGVHGVHRGLGHLVLGANTEKILMSASCPTLTIGAHVLAGVDLALDFKEILYVSDLSPASATAAPYAYRLSRDFNATVEVLQVKQEGESADNEQQMDAVKEYCASIQRTLPAEDAAWCNQSIAQNHRLSSEQVMERAEGVFSGLIVLGVQPATRLDRHMHTSLAYQLLAKATCPILSICEDLSAQPPQ